jgi:hypothetical protein
MPFTAFTTFTLVHTRRCPYASHAADTRRKRIRPAFEVCRKPMFVVCTEAM